MSRCFLLKRTYVKMSSVQNKTNTPRKSWMTKALLKYVTKRPSLYMVGVLSDREILRKIYKKYTVTKNKLLRKKKRVFQR